MQDLTGKSTGSSLTAVEWNELPQEVQNIIEAFGEVLSSGNLDQLGEAISIYAAMSEFYTCTGSVNAYVATVISGVQGPTDYIDGMKVRMRPNITNTGVSTVNVNALGVKSIVKEDASAIPAGVLSTTRDAFMRYDSGLDKFRLSNWSSNDDVSASSTGLNSGYLERNSASVIRLHPGISEVLAINIDGVVVTSSVFIDFDITTDREGAQTEDASTAYYLYVENVAGVITPHVSKTVPDLPGDAGKTGYHPTEVDWRCIGGVWNDVGLDFVVGFWDNAGNFNFELTDADHHHTLANIANDTWSATEVLNIPLCCSSANLLFNVEGVDFSIALGTTNSTGGTVDISAIDNAYTLLHLGVGVTNVEVVSCKGDMPIADMSTPGFKYIMDKDAGDPGHMVVKVCGYHDVFAPRLQG